jgi:hypothetical protein
LRSPLAHIDLDHSGADTLGGVDDGIRVGVQRLAVVANGRLVRGRRAARRHIVLY